MSRASARRNAKRVRAQTVAKRVAEKKIAPASDLKLNLGCGRHKIEGFLGVDMIQGVDDGDVVDLKLDLTYPVWPWKDESVSEIVCNHLLWYFDGPERLRFIEHCHRILKPQGKITLRMAYWASVRVGHDMLYKWPPITELSFAIFNKEWRKGNNQMHYPLTCDFDYGYGYALSGDIVSRNQEYQQMALRENLNAADDLIVTMTKRGNP